MKFLNLVLLILTIISGTNNQNTTFQDISAIAWNHDASKLAVGYTDGSFKVLNAEDMNVVFMQPNRNDFIYPIGSLSWNLSGDKLAVGFSSYGVEIWDMANGQIIRFISDFGEVTWSFDSSYIFILTGSEIPSLSKYDINTGNLIQSAEIFTKDLILFSDGIYAAGLTASSLFIINQINFNEVKSLILRYEDNRIIIPTAIALSPNEQVIAIGYSDNKTRIWDIETEQIVSTLEGGGQEDYNMFITEIAFNASGSRLFTTSYLGIIQSWDTNTWQLIEEVDTHTELRANLSFSPNGRQIAFAPINENPVIIIRDLCDFVAPDVTTLLTIMPQANTFGEEAQICLTENATYTLTASLPAITGDITIIGNGATINMTGGVQIFNVAETGALTLKDVTVSGGNATEGGAIYNAGELNLEDVSFENGE